jgi:hypothetical protein
MQVSFLEISRNAFSREFSTIIHYDLKGDREHPSKPNVGLQYYYYETAIGVEKAFEELRGGIIKNIEQEILLMRRDIETLQKMKV